MFFMVIDPYCMLHRASGSCEDGAGGDCDALWLGGRSELHRPPWRWEKPEGVDWAADGD